MSRGISKLVYGNQGQLGQKKSDEFYTKREDVYEELSYWGGIGKFKGKNIICPCDWTPTEDKMSVRIIFEGKNIFTVFNDIKRQAYTLFDPPETDRLIPTDTDLLNLVSADKYSSFLVVLFEHAREWGISSITASGYNLTNSLGICCSNIDYSQYDICITNPPFSKYKYFMEELVGKIDYLLIAPFTNRVAPSCMVPIMEGKAFLGKGISKHITFSTPGNKFDSKVINCDWITTFSDAQVERDSRHFTTGIKFEEHKDKFIVLTQMTTKEGTHPIKISSSEYPDDYDGWMMGSVMVLDYLDQSKYEWVCLSCQGYLNKEHPERNPLNRDVRNDLFVIDDVSYFNGNILFRKKPVKN